jgi:hypothetical protein
MAVILFVFLLDSDFWLLNSQHRMYGVIAYGTFKVENSTDLNPKREKNVPPVKIPRRPLRAGGLTSNHFSIFEMASRVKNGFMTINPWPCIPSRPPRSLCFL